MNILAFSTSTSRNSINAALVRITAARLQGHLPAARIRFIDLMDYEMPIYSIDRQNDGGIPTPAQTLYEQIGAADALLIGYAEHNGNYTAAWKNIFDWVSRIDREVFQGKPMVITATSPGPGGGGNVLNLAKGSAPFWGAQILGAISVPKWGEAYDPAAGDLTRDDDIARLEAALTELADQLKAAA